MHFVNSISDKHLQSLQRVGAYRCIQFHHSKEYHILSLIILDLILISIDNTVLAIWKCSRISLKRTYNFTCREIGYAPSAEFHVKYALFKQFLFACANRQ
jgi:hypothetical protein